MGKKINSLSLSLRLPLIYILSYLVIAVVILISVYIRFDRRMKDEFTRMAEGVTNLMAEALDPDRIDYYIAENYDSPEYMDILKYYHSLKDNYPDVYYMYVYRFYEKDTPRATVVIDLDEEYSENPPQESRDWIGSNYDADEPFASEIETLIKGREPVYHTVHTQDGEYLLSYVRPVLDKGGNYACSVCVDFSMDYIRSSDRIFVLKLMSGLGILMLLILFINIYIIRKRVTGPLEKIGDCIDGFVYNTDTDRFRNVQALEDLEMESDNEVGKLYQSLVTSMKESLYYMTYLNKAKNEIEDRDKEIREISRMTYKDGLTGVGNKAAFMRDTALNDEKILKGDTSFAVVMVDVNNLKYVNDTYGHEAGDKYILGCCRMVCGVFKHSPVYRIGGDEFAVILTGEDFEKRHDLYIHATMDFKMSFSKKKAEPWEKYSASIGIGEYKSGDMTANVIKRADKLMYSNKKAFKKKNGSYGR